MEYKRGTTLGHYNDETDNLTNVMEKPRPTSAKRTAEKMESAPLACENRRYELNSLC